MPEAEARIETKQASTYLTSVAEAFVHTFPVRFDTLTGEVSLPGAQLIMTADSDSLALRLVADDPAKLEAAKEVAALHVERAAGEDTGVRCVWRALA